MQTAWSEEWETSSDPNRLLGLLGDEVDLHRVRLYTMGTLRYELGGLGQIDEKPRDFLNRIDELLASNHLHDEKRWAALHRKYLKHHLGELPDRVLTILSEPNEYIQLQSVLRDIVNEFRGKHAREVASRKVGPAPSDIHPHHEWHRQFTAAYLEEVRPAANLLRCIFPNIVNPARFEASWRTDTARGIARRIFDKQDFTAMPILADAIQDAGCEDERILGHCRGDGPHARGCWVLEAILEG